MTPKLTSDQRQAIDRQHGAPVVVEDDQNQAQYVIISRAQFEQMQRLLYDDSDMDPSEALPLLPTVFGGEEGWDAPGMEAYDDYDSRHPLSPQ